MSVVDFFTFHYVSINTETPDGICYNASLYIPLCFY